MQVALVILAVAILVLVAGLAIVGWVFVRPSAVYDAMKRQGAAEIARNAAIEESKKAVALAAAASADAEAQRGRAVRAEEKLRATIAKYLPHLTGDDLAGEFVRVLSGPEPGPDPAGTDGGARAVGPDGLPLRPVDPFADGQ